MCRRLGVGVSADSQEDQQRVLEPQVRGVQVVMKGWVWVLGTRLWFSGIAEVLLTPFFPAPHISF